MKTGPQGIKKDRVSGLFSFHRVFIPQNGGAPGQGGAYGQDALVGGATEPQPQVFQSDHKGTVHQNIQQLQKLPAVLSHAPAARSSNR